MEDHGKEIVMYTSTSGGKGSKMLFVPDRTNRLHESKIRGEK